MVPSLCFAFSLKPGTDIRLIHGKLFINGKYVPKTKYIDPDRVLETVIHTKNNANKISSSVTNNITIIGSEITSSGKIRKKRFSGMDATGYKVKKFKINKSRGSSGLGATSSRHGGVTIKNNVKIVNSRIDKYEENIGIVLKSRSLTGAKVKNDVEIRKSRIGVR